MSIENNDQLIEKQNRIAKGAFYTPLQLVAHSYKLLDLILPNWQNDYIVWDMACGTGNLLREHKHPENVYMSTIDQHDIDLMKKAGVCNGVNIFQYDYMNDDIAEDCTIDYTITNKVPPALRQAIYEAKIQKQGHKPILVLLNPPYGEPSDINRIIGKKDSNERKSINKNNLKDTLKRHKKIHTMEVATMFTIRMMIEIERFTLALYNKLKYMTAPRSEKFRQYFRAEYKAGFIVHSKIFNGIAGDFPISFIIWDASPEHKPIQESNIMLDIYDKHLVHKGTKSITIIPKEKLLNKWVEAEKDRSKPMIPLTNAITPAKKYRD